MSTLEYNITLSSSSPVFQYQPYRDGAPTQGWNASYTGTTVWDPNNPWGTGVPYRKTMFEGSIVSIDFVGTAIYLCFTHTSSSYTFAVDQRPLPTAGDPTDPACAPYGSAVGSMVMAQNLTDSPHTAVLELSVGDWSSGFDFFGGVVTVSAGDAGNTLLPLHYIDNDDPSWTYLPQAAATGEGGQWYNSLNRTSGDWGSDREVTCDYGPGTTASYTFGNATAFYLLGGVQSNTLGYTITFDGVPSTYNASSFFIVPQQVLFFRGALDPSTNHTLTLADYSAQGGASAGGCVNLDALVVVSSTPPVGGNSTASGSSTGSSSTPTSTPSSSSVPAGAIAGGVVGGLALLALLALVAWLLLRRHRRQQAQLLPLPLDGQAAPYRLDLNGTGGTGGVLAAGAAGAGVGTAAGAGTGRPGLTPRGSEKTANGWGTPIPSPPLAAGGDLEKFGAAPNGLSNGADDAAAATVAVAAVVNGTAKDKEKEKEKEKREKSRERVGKGKGAGVKRKPVPRALDSEQAAAMGLPVVSPRMGSGWSLDSSGGAASAPGTPGTPGTTGTPGSPPSGAELSSSPGAPPPIDRAGRADRRARRQRRRPADTGEQASTLDLVQMLGRPGSGAPPGYEEV
ncbi:hypothetical protein CALCODRAFT_497846 [Calocera cornea HHB12733]|uniref:Epidermal growth factor receptor-like transmembrane-juxtamembrane segment domain-containing protein n=1 Tax=Calocera cornea HHB12733 TaxID=1353952 RepID=A0A165F2I2_9BASI|nr:hypothetical protein CALCODRAFT_497846 [Calocera cornea HHB12733]